jgi:YHS domain-containing protein
MWKRRTFAQLLAAFVLAPLQALAQAVAPTGERLGLKGYDPVAYFTDGKPRPGASEFEYSWDGVRYRFASAAHRELFKANPDKYAPQFGGSCAMNMSNDVRCEADRSPGRSLTASSTSLPRCSDMIGSAPTRRRPLPRPQTTGQTSRILGVNENRDAL